MMNFFTSRKSSSEVKTAVDTSFSIPASRDDISKSLLKGTIFFDYRDYDTFWRYLAADSSLCSRYIARIINLFANCKADKEKMKTLLQKTIETEFNYFLMSLANTLFFIEMFVGFDREDLAYTEAVRKYERVRANLSSSKLRAVDATMNEFLKLNAPDHDLNRAVPLIVHCVSLESDEEEKKVRDRAESEMNFLDESGLENMIDFTRCDYPFTFFWLCKRSRQTSSSHVFYELLKLLNWGTNTSISVPMQSQLKCRAMSIFLMLFELLTQSPTADDAWMQKACGIISCFYKWPKPYGLLARDMVQFLEIERRSPGYHLRKRLLNECPFLRLSEATEPELKQLSKVIQSGSGKVYTFLDGSSPVSKSCIKLFSMVPLNREASVTDRSLEYKLKKEIITHIVELDLCLDAGEDASFSKNEKSDEKDPLSVNIKPEWSDLLSLNSKSEADIDRWYHVALRVCAKAETLPSSIEDTAVRPNDREHIPPGGLAKLYREAYLSQLVDEIKPGIQYACRRSAVFDKATAPTATSRASVMNCRPSDLSPPPPFTPSLGRILSVGVDENGDSSVERLISQPVLPFGHKAPTLPDVRFSVFEFQPDVLVAPHASKRISVPMRTKELKYLTDSADVDAIRDMIEDSRRYHNNSSALLDVKVVLLGGNFVVHKFLCAFVSFARSSPSILSSVLFHIYIVPSSRNDIATFLARCDKWYRRHVYYPFIGPVPICPQYDFTRDADSVILPTSDNSSVVTPITGLKSLLEDFTRHAQHTINGRIFECLCWDGTAGNADVTDNAPSVVIPFVVCVEIGAFVQAVYYHQNRPQSGSQLSKQLSPIKHSVSGIQDFCEYIPCYQQANNGAREAFYSDDFKPKLSELSISYAPSTMTGEVEDNMISRADRFVSLKLNNAPEMYDDFGAPLQHGQTQNSIPTSIDNNWLVLKTRSIPKESKDPLLDRKVPMKGPNSRDPFLDAMLSPESFDLEVNLSVIDVTASNPLETFHVMIDGRLFGPYKRLVVRPCEALTEPGSGQQSTLAIKSFVPITP